MSNKKTEELQNDWRYKNMDLLKGVKLEFKRYRAPSETWDHDHCAGCWAKFAEFDLPDILHYGYATCEDYIYGVEYEWVCEQCFIDLNSVMGWTVVGDSPEQVRLKHKEGNETPHKAPDKPLSGWIAKPIRRGPT